MYAFRRAPVLAWLVEKLKEKTNIVPSKQFVFEDYLNEIGTLEIFKKS